MFSARSASPVAGTSGYRSSSSSAGEPERSGSSVSVSGLDPLGAAVKEQPLFVGFSPLVSAHRPSSLSVIKQQVVLPDYSDEDSDVDEDGEAPQVGYRPELEAEPDERQASLDPYILHLQQLFAEEEANEADIDDDDDEFDDDSDDESDDESDDADSGYESEDTDDEDTDDMVSPSASDMSVGMEEEVLPSPSESQSLQSLPDNIAMAGEVHFHRQPYQMYVVKYEDDQDQVYPGSEHIPVRFEPMISHPMVTKIEISMTQPSAEMLDPSDNQASSLMLDQYDNQEQGEGRDQPDMEPKRLIDSPEIYPDSQLSDSDIDQSSKNPHQALSSGEPCSAIEMLEPVDKINTCVHLGPAGDNCPQPELLDLVKQEADRMQLMNNVFGLDMADQDFDLPPQFIEVSNQPYPELLDLVKPESDRMQLGRVTVQSVPIQNQPLPVHEPKMDHFGELNCDKGKERVNKIKRWPQPAEGDEAKFRLVPVNVVRPSRADIPASDVTNDPDSVNIPETTEDDNQTNQGQQGGAYDIPVQWGQASHFGGYQILPARERPVGDFRTPDQQDPEQLDTVTYQLSGEQQDPEQLDTVNSQVSGEQQDPEQLDTVTYQLSGVQQDPVGAFYTPQQLGLDSSSLFLGQPDPTDVSSERRFHLSYQPRAAQEGRPEFVVSFEQSDDPDNDYFVNLLDQIRPPLVLVKMEYTPANCEENQSDSVQSSDMGLGDYYGGQEQSEQIYPTDNLRFYEMMPTPGEVSEIVSHTGNTETVLVDKSVPTDNLNSLLTNNWNNGQPLDHRTGASMTFSVETDVPVTRRKRKACSPPDSDTGDRTGDRPAKLQCLDSENRLWFGNGSFVYVVETPSGSNTGQRVSESANTAPTTSNQTESDQTASTSDRAPDNEYYRIAPTRGKKRSLSEGDDREDGGCDNTLFTSVKRPRCEYMWVMPSEMNSTSESTSSTLSEGEDCEDGGCDNTFTTSVKRPKCEFMWVMPSEMNATSESRSRKRSRESEEDSSDDDICHCKKSRAE